MDPRAQHLKKAPTHGGTEISFKKGEPSTVAVLLPRPAPPASPARLPARVARDVVVCVDSLWAKSRSLKGWPVELGAAKTPAVAPRAGEAESRQRKLSAAGSAVSSMLALVPLSQNTSGSPSF